MDLGSRQGGPVHRRGRHRTPSQSRVPEGGSMSATAELTTTEPTQTEYATNLEDVLAEQAAAADLAGRPAPEAIAALRTSPVIGLAVPVEYGGVGGGGPALPHPHRTSPRPPAAP